jgi:LPS export ABC transporter protein LptC
LVFLTFTACENSKEEVMGLAKELNTKIDIGEKIRIIYSDSGKIQVILTAPMLERHNSNNDPKDIFPKGIKIDFKDEKGETNAWLEADFAERIPMQSKMVARGNVRMYNLQDDKLTTSELIWDENTHLVYTDKFVKITRPASRDTTYGYGFEANEGFTKIVVKRKIQSKLDASVIDGGFKN